MMIHSVFLVGFLFLLVSCTNREIRIVEERWPDGSEKIVRYYNKSNYQLCREERFYQNGNKQMQGTFKNGKKDGVWYFWYENGQLWSEGEFENGLSHGYRKVYHPNSQLYYEGEFHKGETVGTWKFYDEHGRLIKKVIFKKNN